MLVDRSTGRRVYAALAVDAALAAGAIAAVVGGAIILAFILMGLAMAIGVFVVPRAIEAAKWHPAELHLSQTPSIDASMRWQPEMVRLLDSPPLTSISSWLHRVVCQARRTSSATAYSLNESREGAGTPGGRHVVGALPPMEYSST